MKHNINISDYRVSPGTRVRLEKWPTRSAPLYRSDKDYKSSWPRALTA